MSSLKDRIAAQRKALAEKNAGRERAYKFKVGKTVLRILPGCADPDQFAQEYGAHYIKDPTSGSLIAVVGDASICYGKPDPVRDAIGMLIDKYSARGDDEGAKKVKEWLARSVNVMNAQVVGGVDEENKGKVVRPEFSDTAYNNILSILEDYAAVDSDKFDEDFRAKGFCITVERIGTGMNDTKYTFSAYPKQPEKPIPQDVLDARIPLQSYIDAKFGANVHNALTKLSALLGRDVTGTALGSAIAATAALAAPKSDDFATREFAPAETPSSGDDELLSLDAEFEDKPSGAAKAAPAPVKDDIDDILADLDNL